MSSIKSSVIEAKAIAAERSIANKASPQSALEAAITSAELYMQALKLSDNSSDKKRLNNKLSELLKKAESLKARQEAPRKNPVENVEIDKYPISTRILSTREEIILLEGSKLNGMVFKPWKQKPDASEFELQPSEELYTEEPLSLSEDQLRSFAGWERGAQAITKIRIFKEGVLLPNDPIMTLPGRPDLVQDMASDCSVVASLCSGAARAEKGHPRLLSSVMYPYEVSDQSVKSSANGKYILRLYFNGCWRRVDIDDYLPTSSTSRVLHVVDRSHPGLLWPALIEKAYLKVRGGYDFPGSNSGTDLAVFTGWIPQQVFLHDEDVDQHSLWQELEQAFTTGDILLTIGTGRLSRREQKQLGLAAEHDYAILDLKNRGGIREMLIKNPWSDGEVWKGAARRRPNPSHEHDEDEMQSPLEDNIEMLPGTFWMDYNSIFQHYENLYINWNPALFSNRQDLHFSWQIPESALKQNILLDNPQFSVSSQQSGEMWLLLNRHFRTGDYTHENSGKNGYISLYLYYNNGYRVISTENVKKKSPFMDSPNTLLRFDAEADTVYTVVIVSQDLPPGKHNFTLSAFARSTIQLSQSSSRYTTENVQTAAWTRHTAGGNTDSMNYLQNPQFAFPIKSANTSVAIVLRLMPNPVSSTDEPDIHVKALLVYSPSQDAHIGPGTRAHRVNKLRNRDIAASSGDYRRGCAVIETKLNPGIYTIICSTFDERQLAKFSLGLYTSKSQDVQLTPVASEGSGRLKIVSDPAIFENGVARLVAPLTIPRIGKAIFIVHAKIIPGSRSSSTSSLYKISLEQGQGSYARVIATSANEETTFVSIYNSLRIDDTDLNPDLHQPGTGGLWVVLERPVQSASEGNTGGMFLEVELLAEERLHLGSWTAVEL